MRRRRSYGWIPAAVSGLLLVVLLAAGVLWFNGAFLPGWIHWNERTEALDKEGAGAVSSIVVKNRRLAVYDDGEEVYRSPSKWKVQDVVWQDLDGDGERELAVLYWSRSSAGEFCAGLTEKGKPGFSQHLAVLDDLTNNTEERWVSAPLVMQASALRMDADGYLVLAESVGKQSSWVWNGYAVAASDTARPIPPGSVVAQQEETVTTPQETGQQAEAPADNPDVQTVQNDEPADETDDAEEAGQDGEASDESSVTFLAVGDDLVHENVWRQGQANGGDYSYLFENVIPMINTVDFACLNQETMFVEETVGYTGYPMFGSPLGIGEAAIRAGFDIVTCATNHSLDKGSYGIETTADFFESHKAEITYLGIYTRDKWYEETHEIKTVNKNGITFALLNYTYGLNGIPIPAEAPYCIDTYRHDASWYGEETVMADEQKMRETIRRAKEIADIVIFFPHWGQEYVYEPVDNAHKSFDQVYWTNIMLEEGVDIVVGTHPHVVEPVEMLMREDGHEMLVYYSLGNFVSGQDEMPRVVCGMATFTVTRKGDRCFVSSYDMLPVVTHREAGGVTTAYMMDDYTEEMASRHVLGVNIESMRELFRKIVDWDT